MSVFNLSLWLRRSPQPVAVIVRDAEGKDQRVEVGKDGRNWKNLTNTIEGMKPFVRLTLLNGQSTVIRVKSFDEETADEDETSKGEENEIVVFARLLTEATKDQPILKHAMEFISRQATSIAAYMSDNERLRQENNRLRLQIGQLQLTPTGDEGEGDPVLGLLGQMAAGMQAAQAVKSAKLRQVPAGKEVVTK